MALSMDEQRILDQIERGLASADPALATRMASFGASRRITTLRMRRLRLVASLMTLLVVASVSLVVYALVPFRTVTDRHAGQQGQFARPPGDDRTVASGPFARRPAGQASAGQASAGQASAAPASAAPASASPALGTSAAASSAASQAPSTHAGASASPASAHQQPRRTPAQ